MTSCWGHGSWLWDDIVVIDFNDDFIVVGLVNDVIVANCTLMSW